MSKANISIHTIKNPLIGSQSVAYEAPKLARLDLAKFCTVLTACGSGLLTNREVGGNSCDRGGSSTDSIRP